MPSHSSQKQSPEMEVTGLDWLIVICSDGLDSRVEVLVLQTKAARGTQERLARAVCALTF